MGVPVITLEGQKHAGRVGHSLLGNLGLEELIARTPDDYVSRAVSLARDPQRVREFRDLLRDRLQNSVICDADGFARRIEQAYRQMWIKWCASQTP